MTFHPEILPPSQARALRALAPVAVSKGFYLAGGTALALLLGHRESIDFDWFRPEGFDPLVLRGEFPDLDVRQTRANTLHGFIGDVAVSFLGYPYPLLQPAVTWPEYGLALASITDIACMKLAAIAQRGARKDFIDLVAILGTGLELPRLLEQFRQKYTVRDFGHVLVALAYFDDAEREPMPKMLATTDWESVKAEIRQRLRAFAGS